MTKSELTEQKESLRVSGLLSNNPLINATHLVASAAFVYLMWSLLPQAYLKHWGAVALVLLLAGVLFQSLFERNQDISKTASKWESRYTLLAGCIGTSFAIAYAYALLNVGEVAWSKIVMISVSQLSIFTVLSRASMKTLLALAAPIGIAVIGVLLSLMTTSSIEIAVVFALYLIILSAMGRSLHARMQLALTLKIEHKEAIEQTKSYKQALSNASFKDPLTHVFNKRFFDLIINNEVRRAKRSGTNLSLAFIELDCFDKYIEHYGKERSEKCLKSITKKLNRIVSRGGEYIYRYSDEQFALILPNTTSSQALGLITKITHAVNLADIQHLHSTVEDQESITVSIGLSEFKTGDIVDVDTTVEHALKALSHAKHKGGNEVEIFDFDMLKTGDSDGELDTQTMLPEANFNVPEIEEAPIVNDNPLSPELSGFNTQAISPELQNVESQNADMQNADVQNADVQNADMHNAAEQNEEIQSSENTSDMLAAPANEISDIIVKPLTDEHEHIAVIEDLIETEPSPDQAQGAQEEPTIMTSDSFVAPELTTDLDILVGTHLSTEPEAPAEPECVEILKSVVDDETQTEPEFAEVLESLIDTDSVEQPESIEELENVCDTESAIQPPLESMPGIDKLFDAAPSIDAVPAIDTPPAFDATPSFDAAPAIDTPPAFDATPSFDSTPDIDAAPAIDTTPAFDATPSFDAAPAIDTPPAFDETPSFNSTPNIDATPAIDAPPAFDTAPSIDAAPSSDTLADSLPNIAKPPQDERQLTFDNIPEVDMPEIDNETETSNPAIMEKIENPNQLTLVDQPDIEYK
ncbi:GGDEF domain-containing protein [Glaciecola petra]|uniref:diguanylate cyclase n=1 Tax=Glaciecola petra TaxID=3075602 RepID=A0ABU2ZQZ6_9ALTE|nr:diguanylate cyclase [Aestuariibacter sp. P117]MDT0595052.1 diguanylate cyclase [Aestuariibacter sp. P117]